MRAEDYCGFSFGRVRSAEPWLAKRLEQIRDDSLHSRVSASGL
jgi:hypothetical protein